MNDSEILPYFPQFLLKYWHSDIFASACPYDEQRYHTYDVHNNILSEARRIPQQTVGVFADFRTQEVSDGHCDQAWVDTEAYCSIALETAELSFSRLEAKAELAFEHLMQNVSATQSRTKTESVTLEGHELDTLRRYFLFIRFRNSAKYSSMLSNMVQTITWKNESGHGVLLSVWHRIRRNRALTSLYMFLQHSSTKPRPTVVDSEEVHRYCWNLLESEVSLGIASEGQEFILSENCVGDLDASFRDDPDSCRFFVPLSPTVALYVLGDMDEDLSTLGRHPAPHPVTISIDCGLEEVSDVHLRNTVLLHHLPNHIYFSNLLSIAKTINLYQIGSLFADDHADYTRLMHRCQQKATQEQLTKTLVVKGSMLADLTDQVARIGNSPVAHGSFSDVWKGVWTISRPFSETKHRTVALKILRQVMPDNIRKKIIDRLQDELVAWHTLQHDNIAQLFGVVQSCDTIAMISPWCDNGTLIQYLKEHNPSADRLSILVQISSGVLYLHGCRPIVVHGDLKGCNILIDDHGVPLITDFGLAKVVENLSDDMQLATSFFAGSTRWMAPELILALVEDEIGRSPPITTYSDVYSFACVCLEVATSQVPFPHRSNDHAVTVDIMRGVRPSRGTSCLLNSVDVDGFWEMLDQCWDPAFYLRPSMLDLTHFLRGQMGAPSLLTNGPHCDGRMEI